TASLLCQQAIEFAQLLVVHLAVDHQPRLEIRVVGGDQALDRIHPVVEPLGEAVELFQQMLVIGGDGRGGLPLGDIVQDQPWQTDHDGRYDDDFFHGYPSSFAFLSVPPMPSERFISSSSSSILSEPSSAAIS